MTLEGRLCEPVAGRALSRSFHKPMIGRLAGTIVAEELDGLLVVDVGGVGYEVMTPSGTAGRVRASGTLVVLHTHLQVKDDALELYGFATESERRVFRLLLTVPNVGPKTALGVLSALPPAELARAVQARDLGRLTRIGGVGKKTAERLAMELREKLSKLGPFGEESVAASPRDTDTERLLGALTNMGYRPAEAQRAVQALGDRIGREPLSELLRAALATLA